MTVLQFKAVTVEKVTHYNLQSILDKQRRGMKGQSEKTECCIFKNIYAVSKAGDIHMYCPSSGHYGEGHPKEKKHKTIYKNDSNEHKTTNK